MNDAVGDGLDFCGSPVAGGIAFKLGGHVRIIDADIYGTIISHTEYVGGTERFGVQYWHEGKRELLNCAGWELEMVTP